MAAPPIDLASPQAEPATLVMKRVAASGRFVHERTVLLDNKLRRGRPGYEVLTPLRLNGEHVLVNRGWAAAGRTREALPQVPAPQGIVRVEGLALARLPQALAAGPAGSGKVRQNLELDAFARETGLRFAPFVIEQHLPDEDGLVREWTPPHAGVEKHQSYALQWYSLAVLAAVLFLVLSFHRVGAR